MGTRTKMKLTCVFIALTVAAAAAAPLSESEYDALWTQFKLDYSKTYDAAEEAARLLTFKTNVDFITSHNARADEHGWTVGMNQFGDMSRTEFKNTMLTYKADQKKANPVKIFSEENLAGDVDWTTKGAMQIATGKLQSFSEQELVDCAGSFGNQGCNGGLMDNGFKYIQQSGDSLETDYPYTAKTGT